MPARCLQDRAIPILVEAERLRDRLPELLQRADFVTSSANYPRVRASGALASALSPLLGYKALD